MSCPCWAETSGRDPRFPGAVAPPWGHWPQRALRCCASPVVLTPDEGYMDSKLKHDLMREACELDTPDDRKGRRNRHETACKDKRRNRGCCGICGSENVIRQGVAVCHQCGEEEPYVMIEADWFQTWFDAAQQKESWPHPPCGHEPDKRQRLTMPQDDYVLKCPDCGAVHGPRCPACGKPSWKAGDKAFCTQCGFRRERL